MVNNELYGRCPAEEYDADIATVVLHAIYRSRVECSHAHGCVRKVCAIEERWARRDRSRETWTNLTFGGFIAAAHNGPTRPDAKGLETPRTTGEEPCADTGNPPQDPRRDGRTSN